MTGQNGEENAGWTIECPALIGVPTAQPLHLWCRNHHEVGGTKTAKARVSGCPLWKVSSVYDKETASMKFQQYVCLNKSWIMTIQLTCQCEWGKSHKASSLDEEPQTISMMDKRSRSILPQRSSLINYLIRNGQPFMFIHISQTKRTQGSKFTGSTM